MRLILLCTFCLLLGVNAQASDVLCIGDSATEGVGVKPEETFCSQLHGKNIGLHGAFAPRGVELLKADLKVERPRVVTIMYGLNDCYYHENLAVYRNALKTMVRLVRRKGGRPILMTSNAFGDATNPLPNRNTDLKACVVEVRKLARSMDVPLVDNYQVFSELFMEGFDLHELTVDGVHPSALGQMLIYNALRPVVRAELRE